MKKIMSNIKNVIRIDDNPESIARGIGLGSFIGMLPIPGFQILVALGLSGLLKVNKKAACSAVFNTNVVTGTFVFAFNYWLGKQLLGITSCFTMPDKISIDFISSIIKAGSDVYLSLTVGGIISGIVVGLIAYLMARFILSIKISKSLV